ncbi:unnamed protein product [Vitrella brassicaformis CCMP3155]|uniref:HTH CENPB-type domain-containing protein n=1 Tax=Vitrella brassicaformis (strain CCMP3155) TaxID=1169540 RepID=A0A0G4G0R4_VITBC|nr:unnamed protein product [Vitrella brassicaformis CCMP3155]|eukprot:CEM21216.1 unnamed protein product [Vitrella brassicaformis CCMP3155]
MERLHYYYDNRGRLLPIPPAEPHRQGAVDEKETDTRDGGAGPHETRAGGQPAATSAADMDGSSRVEEDIMLTKLLEGVRATDPESGGRYEIATVTVAGRQTKAIRWRPTDVCVASDRRDVHDQGLPDPPKRHMPSSPPVTPCNGRDPSPDGSRSPKRRRTEPPQHDSHHEGRPMGQTNKTVLTRRVPTLTSDVPGVCWLTSSRSWVASWVEKVDKRWKHKFFSASNHGFDKAKALAEKHRRKMERIGRAGVKQRSESGVRGVSFNKNAWVASWYDGGKQKKKHFSVRQLGYEGAKKAAIAHRREMQLQHCLFKDRGQAADLSFSLYPELMAKAVTAPQTTAPLPPASTAQTAAASPLIAAHFTHTNLPVITRGRQNNDGYGPSQSSTRHSSMLSTPAPEEPTHQSAPPHPSMLQPPPAADGSHRGRAASLPPPTAGRLLLVQEFESRKINGEEITMPQFADEKGIDVKHFKEVYYAIKKQIEQGTQVYLSASNKRIRQPWVRYRQIENEMRQWVATQGDSTSIRRKDTKAKAMDIARQLGESNFKASDQWFWAFRRRCQQHPPVPCAPVAGTISAPDNMGGMAVRGAVKKRSEHQSGVRGVYRHSGSSAWVASWYEGHKKKEKLFSVRQLGYEGAKKAAIAHRREMQLQHCLFKDRGQAAGLCSPRDEQAASPSRNALAESSTASPADVSFPLYPELMAKAVSDHQTTAPLPTASTTQTAAVSPRVAIAL